MPTATRTAPRAVAARSVALDTRDRVRPGPWSADNYADEVSTEAAPSVGVVADLRPRHLLDPVRVPVLAAVGSALVATGVALHGAVGPGLWLVRDFVAVPRPAAPTTWFPTSAAALRAWPLDALAWASSFVVPPAAFQFALLVGALVGAGVGAGLLVRRAGAAASTAAAWVAVWNPYVAERLLLGQVPTLLGYSSLAWIVVVGRSRLGHARRLALLVLVALPAALTPWGGVVALVTALLVELSRPDRTLPRLVLVGALGLLWCSPWLVPALFVGGVPADPDGPVAFALSDDSGLGTWASGLMGGGVWATGARPPSRTDPVALAASCALLVAAVAGAAVLAARSWRGTRPRRAAIATASGAVAVLVGIPTLAWWASGPGLDVVVALQQVPGAALVRDQHRMLAPAVMATAVLVGEAVGWLARHGGRLAGALGAVLAVSLAVASVPDLPGTLRTAYRSVAYPAEWATVVDVIAADSARPTVLSLPWQPLRRPAWAGNPPFLDPLPRAVPGEVLVSSELSVRRDGSVVVVDDSPVREQWATGTVSGASLRRHGVTHVVEWLGTPGTLPTSHDGWRLLHAGPSFRVWDVTAAP